MALLVMARSSGLDEQRRFLISSMSRCLPLILFCRTIRGPVGSVALASANAICA